jgi:hypothetical protein
MNNKVNGVKCTIKHSERVLKNGESKEDSAPLR